MMMMGLLIPTIQAVFRRTERQRLTELIQMVTVYVIHSKLLVVQIQLQLIMILVLIINVMEMMIVVGILYF